MDENAQVLTCSGYGNSRRICAECAKLIDKLTLSTDYDEIHEAGKTLVKIMDDNHIDDEVISEAMDDLFVGAAERADKIKEGTYDFSEDEKMKTDDTPDEELNEDGIPEDLAETEEDRELDRIEEERDRKFDTVLNYLWLAVGVGIVAYLVYRFFLR